MEDEAEANQRPARAVAFQEERDLAGHGEGAADRGVRGEFHDRLAAGADPYSPHQNQAQLTAITGEFFLWAQSLGVRL